METSVLLLMVSIAIAVSSLLDAFSASSFRLKLASGAVSLLLAVIPLMTKLYSFHREKRSRRRLLLDATIRYFLGDAFALYNFRAWIGGHSTYSNIFYHKKAFFSDEHHCVSTTVPADVINEVYFGHNDESPAAYVTERVHLQASDGSVVRGTLVVRDYEQEHDGVRYAGNKGEMFVRGAHKFERRAPFIPHQWVCITYPSVRNTQSLGEVKVILRYDHINSTIDYKIHTDDFPEGKLTPKVRGCNLATFIKCIVMLEYAPAWGWVTRPHGSLGRSRRGAFIFHSRSLNAFTEDLKNGANLYEVRQKTHASPCFIE